MTDAKSNGRKSSRSKQRDKAEQTKSLPHRPRKIQTPEEFDILVDSYVNMCHSAKPPEPITLSGLILALGLTSKEGFYHYATYPGFEECVGRARMIVQHAYEKKLHGANASGAIFALKNMGMTDVPLEQIEYYRLRNQEIQENLKKGGSDNMADALAKLADKLPG